jgi:hypothetical protein
MSFCFFEKQGGGNMKKSMIFFYAALGAALLFGCAAQTHYEYRYRVFYGMELPEKENLAPEEFSRMFYPLGSLNRALDLFGEEGFVLNNYQPLGQGHNYLFEFRRPITQQQGKSLSGSRIYGIYQIEKEEKPLVIAVMPSPDGIEVVELEGVKNRYPATLEGKDLIYNTSEGQISLSFTTEGGVEQKIRNVSGDTTTMKNFQGHKFDK